jgi:hypothetical protein
MLWKWIMYVTGAASIVGGYLLLPVTGPGGAALISGGTVLIDRALAMP